MPAEIAAAQRPNGWAAALAFHDAHRRTVNAVLLAVVVLMVVAHIAMALRNRDWRLGDGAHYLDVANTLLTTHTFSTHLGAGLQPEAYRPLGYPAFIAAIEFIAGPHPIAVVVVQELLFLLATILAARFCARFHPAGETLLLGFVLVFPSIKFWPAEIMAEEPCILLVVLGMLCLLSRRRRRGAVAAGFLFGLTAWFRVNLFFLGTAAGLGMALWGKDRSWRRGLIVAAVSLAVMLPNSVRNYRLFGSLSPLPFFSGMGAQLYEISLHSLGGDFKSLLYNNSTAQARSILAAAHGGDMADFTLFPTIADQRTADRMQLQFALRNIRANPGPYFAAVVANWLGIWMVPGEDDPWFSASVRGCVRVAGETVVVLLGFWGMFLAVRHPDRFGIPGSFAAAAAAMCLYMPASLCWFLCYNRYTTPVDLLLFGFAALAGTHLISSIARRGRTTPLGACARPSPAQP